MTFKIKEVAAKGFGSRKVFVDVEEKYLEFKPGIRVLNSNNDKAVLSFVCRHEPGEKYFPEGGFSCVDAGGGKRSFYLDEVIVHPEVFEPKKVVRRGRKAKAK